MSEFGDAEITTPVEVAPPPVENDEKLYRSVRVDRTTFKPEAGTWRVSSQAFADRSRRVSMHRHSLCPNPPHSAPPRVPDKVSGLLIDALVRFTASEIREIDITHPEGSSIRYLCDVEPDTAPTPNGTPQHISHCVITSSPVFPEKPDTPFRKLKERLARLADSREWAIPPDFSLLQ